MSESVARRSEATALRLYTWHDAPVVAVALFALGAGFGQFGAVAALGNVARSFGHLAHGATFAEQAGLSGTLLGVGLAVIRLASLGGLPLASLADRFGRRPVLIASCAVGLALTVVAAVSPSYWWFVAIFAIGRPPLTATNGVAQVCAVELTSSANRAKAVALIAAGYGVGAGLTAIIHGLGESALGFRGVFALAVIPLLCLPMLSRLVVEPSRFSGIEAAQHQRPILGAVGHAFRGRLGVVCILAFAFSVITGPANSLVFIYAENVRHVSGVVMSLMVVGAGVTGLAGLVLGQRMADRMGRRPTIAISMAGLAAFGVLTYNGSKVALVIGYVLGVLAGATFAPAGGTLANELFPTSVRASVTGWYTAAGVLGAVAGLVFFGFIADASSGGDHAGIAAAITFLPMVPVSALLLVLPETRGKEPEDLWGEPGRTTPLQGPSMEDPPDGKGNEAPSD